MDKDGNKIIWTVVIISAIAIIGLMFINFMPSQTANIKTAISNELSSFGNDHNSDKSSSSSSSHTAVGTNLLTGTAKFEFPFINNNSIGTQTIQKYDDETNYIQYTSNTPRDVMGPWWGLTPKVGQVYTLSADVCGNGYILGGYFHYEGADNGNLGRVDLTNNWQRISNTFRVNTTSGWHNWDIYAFNSTLLKVKHIKIEKGSNATPWVP